MHILSSNWPVREVSNPLSHYPNVLAPPCSGGGSRMLEPPHFAAAGRCQRRRRFTTNGGQEVLSWRKVVATLCVRHAIVISHSTAS